MQKTNGKWQIDAKRQKRKEAKQDKNYASMQLDIFASKTAFSLSEIMIVFLILTIVLAMTIPIISKRSKIRTSSGSTPVSNSNVISCIKVVNSTLDKTLTSDIKSLSYVLIGGGGGGSGRNVYGGGGGGSSNISIYNTAGSRIFTGTAKGGNGGVVNPFQFVRESDGSNGEVVSGNIYNLTTNYKVKIYVGGGGGGGGDGYGYSFGSGGSGSIGGDSGSNPGSYHLGGGSNGGNDLAGGSGYGGGGGAGGYGAYGGINSSNSGASATSYTGTGKGGASLNYGVYGSTSTGNYGQGGEGGSATLIYTTTSSSCDLL